MSDRKVGKCPGCCPDGGAILRTEYRDSRRVWACQNCNHTRPVGSRKTRRGVTPSQTRVIDLIRRKGWEVTVTFLSDTSRDVWVSATHPSRSWLLGDRICGRVGPRGSYEITTFGVGSSRKVTEYLDIYI